MLVAVKLGHDSAVDETGELVGDEAGVALINRLLKVFPGATLVGPQAKPCHAAPVVTLDQVDPDAVLINMDLVDSIEVWRTLRQRGDNPKVMNFAWRNTSDFDHEYERAVVALSCALFPTFSNSERTNAQIGNLVRELTIQPLAERARSAWVNLGINLERRTERVTTRVPVVLYPAIYMYERKQPNEFIEIVERVSRRTKIQVEARLVESHLASDQAMYLSRQKWAWVGPLTETREQYWTALARTTAFVATARDESYGLEYVEAMSEGVIGIFPDHAWVGPLLPKGYPFIYHNVDEAEHMLYRAVTDPEDCRADLDRCAGGNFVQWIADRHNDDDFEIAIAGQVRTWFG